MDEVAQRNSPVTRTIIDTRYFPSTVAQYVASYRIRRGDGYLQDTAGVTVQPTNEMIIRVERKYDKVRAGCLSGNIRPNDRERTPLALLSIVLQQVLVCQLRRDLPHR